MSMLKLSAAICFVCVLAAESAEGTGAVPVREITGREIWKGEVRIMGVVAVRQGGTLVIEPGTKVIFDHLDGDGDGIGDGELYVEGELHCRGTRTSPVLFSSAGAVEPGRWKYVMVNHAKEATFEWCVFEGAYSGLQIHFSRANVRNCTFRRNTDGFRFSTSNIIVTGCVMESNKHGIRYEERDSSGRICGNEITGNEIGIFAVTASAGKVAIRRNNVYNNGYNIKIGDEQKNVLDFSDNYFGTDDESQIGRKIYDRKFDRVLPAVKFTPILTEKREIGDDGCGKR